MKNKGQAMLGIQVSVAIILGKFYADGKPYVFRKKVYMYTQQFRCYISSSIDRLAGIAWQMKIH